MTSARSRHYGSVKTAIIGDVGGHSEELARALRELGCDPNTGDVPAGLHIVQVGDLIHRGPDTPGVLEMVSRFLDRSPARWTQLIGNHEAQYLSPTGPAFRWPEQLNDVGRQLLRQWWEAGLMVPAAWVPSEGDGILVTHAGVSFELLEQLGGLGLSVQDTVDLLNSPRVRTANGPLWRPGNMLTGVPRRLAGPLWIESGVELYPSWLEPGRSMPWDQVHGHSSVFDFRRFRWRPCPQGVRDRCRADPLAARVTFQSWGPHAITGVDPGHGVRPVQGWEPFIVEA